MIAPDVVLSAAHCGNFKGDNILIGAYEDGKTTGGAVWRKVAKQKKHPQYNGNTDANDFLLLKLQSPVTMSTSVELEINDSYSVPSDGQDLTVMGFGALQEGGNSSPNKLRDVVVQAIDTNTCNAGSSYAGDVLDDSMFCAGKCALCMP